MVRSPFRSARRIAISFVLCAGLGAQAWAQTTDRLLSEATIFNGDRCAVLGVGLNLPVRLVNAFPTEFGDELRIRLTPIEARELVNMANSRESLRAPTSVVGAISRIEFEGDRAEGPTLTITFKKKVYFKLAQGADFRSFIVAISGSKPNAECRPTLERPKDMVSQPQSAPLPTLPAQATAEADPADRAVIADARAALTGGDFGHAIQVLTKLLMEPEGPVSAEAHELLGIARERNHQAAHAKAEYETYLKLYPTGTGADRVRQRLAALLAGDGAPAPPPVPGASQLAQDAPRAPRRKSGDWQLGGSVAAYYMRDESHQQIADAVAQTTTDVIETNLNQILSTADAFANYSNDKIKMKLRATGTYTSEFRVGRKDIGALSALYIDLADTSQRYQGRIGRQTRSTGGVLGRFDGGLFSARMTERLRLDLVGGSPVNSPKDLQLNTNRLFYGASLAFGRFANAWDGDLYLIEQTSSGYLDRRAVGGELRYVAGGRSAFGAVDYDVHFNTMNYALFNGSWQYGDGAAVSFALDFRHSPLLFTETALIGQPVLDLDQLHTIYTDREIHALAMDRAAQSRTANLGITQPLTKKLSFNADVTMSNVLSTPASGGVPGSPASGVEYFYSTQLIGLSLLREGDLGIVGIRYADTANSTGWVVDINSRFPVTSRFRVNPRLQLGDRTSKTTNLTEWSARPSMRINYTTKNKLQFEPEFGAEFIKSDTLAGGENTTGYYVNIGVRRDF